MLPYVTNIHTYIHTYIPTYVRTYIHTYIYTYIHTSLHICIYTFIHMYQYIYRCLCVYMSIPHICVTRLVVELLVLCNPPPRTAELGPVEERLSPVPQSPPSIYTPGCVQAYVHIHMYIYKYVYIYIYIRVYVLVASFMFTFMLILRVIFPLIFMFTCVSHEFLCSSLVFLLISTSVFMFT